MRTRWDDDWLVHDPDHATPRATPQDHAAQQDTPANVEQMNVISSTPIHAPLPSEQGETDGHEPTPPPQPQGMWYGNPFRSPTECSSVGNTEDYIADADSQPSDPPPGSPPRRSPPLPHQTTSLNSMHNLVARPSTPPRTPSGRGTPRASLSASGRGGIGSPSSSRQDINDDDFDGSRLIEEAVRDQDKNNLIPPEPNPDWRPEMPRKSDTFCDPDFMTRVEVRSNTAEQLKEIEERVGVKFVDTVLKRNGGVFRDDVPTAMVPDRGPWNGTIDFVDPGTSGHVV